MLGIPHSPFIHVSCYTYIIHRNMVEQIEGFDVACIAIINPYSSLQCRLPSLCMSDESDI